MSENQVNEGEVKGEQKTSFSQPVEIKGLHYVFEGDILTTPGRLVWHVRVPNWEEQAKKISDDIKKGGVSYALSHALSQFEEKKGSIGSVDLRVREDHIVFQHIRTKTWALPKEFGYNGAKGVGSFLLKNAVAFADIVGLPMVLEPYPDGSSPLSDMDTIEWYRRHGFEFRDGRSHRNISPDYGSMIRMPHEPDFSQPIAAFLK